MKTLALVQLLQRVDEEMEMLRDCPRVSHESGIELGLKSHSPGTDLTARLSPGITAICFQKRAGYGDVVAHGLGDTRSSGRI